MEPASVNEAVKKQHSVVIALGAGASRKSLVRSQRTMHVIKAMQGQGVSRLICQTTLGTGASWANLNFFWKRIMFGLLLRPVFLDHELQEPWVRESGLNWTIVRPSALTDDRADGTYKVDIPPGERGLRLKMLEPMARGSPPGVWRSRHSHIARWVLATHVQELGA